ncbi:sulfite exporter TauE/SafE family protein [Undibacterium cyanobacteriorum]|uniref:Sulfite exporter TauE/SafE family protein n=1 Tax=Undibacterium cyanobacteriorum TaxID=3073561 RepID=A0ABY9RM34_9BURK|nr:sulfite exporter TauE/SafE family protein [Undibacterium sp. 20NA77.5]WMW82278.1 sulfite exporter TauE/SafE family protein [Undibacterium sp. 20NA77.5]
MITWSMWMAAISAGLLGGFHCVGMCGGIAQLLARSTSTSQGTANSVSPANRVIPIHAIDSDPKQESILLQHLGRLTTYAVIGAVFGWFGSYFVALDNERVHQALFIVGNLMLLAVSLRLLGVSLKMPSGVSRGLGALADILRPSLNLTSRHPFLTGLAWGSLPCGLSFVIAPFAILSGAAWSGAVLMLSFGVAALPHLLVTQMLAMRWRSNLGLKVLRIVIGLAMLTIAVLGLFYWDMRSMPDFLCVTPKP